MDTGLLVASILFSVTGIGMIYLGYRILSDERADLVFAPGIDAPEATIARVSGQATVVSGIATIGLGLGTTGIQPTAKGWLLLLVPYAGICLACVLWVRWRL